MPQKSHFNILEKNIIYFILFISNIHIFDFSNIFKNKKTMGLRTNQVIPLVFAFLCFGSIGTAQKAFIKAEKQFQLKAYDLAADNYQRALNENKNCLDCIYGLGMSNMLMNKNMEAYNWFSELETRYTNPQYYLNYGKVLKQLGKVEKAKEYFSSYKEIDPLLGEQLVLSCDFAMAQLKESDKYKVALANWNTPESDFACSQIEGNIVFASYSDTDLPMTNNHKSVNYTIETTKEAVSKTDFLNDSRISQNNIVSISFANNRTCAYIKHNFVNGFKQIDAEELDLGIFVAEMDEDGVLRNERPFPFNSIGYANAFPAFASDGSALYFASNMPGGFGGFDLYVSYNDQGNWSEPINLGASINTQGNEITPFINQTTLYFASDYLMGLGGLDIFKSVEEDGLWLEASNLGKGINSPEDDFYPLYVASDDMLYYTSNRIGGKGKHDIYMAYGIETNNYLSSLDVPSVEVLEVPESKPVQLVEQDVPQALNLNELVVKNTVDIPESDAATVAVVTESIDVKKMMDVKEEISKNIAANIVVADESPTRMVADGEIIINNGEKVFFIQLAAFFSTQGDVNQFRNLSSLGNIYRMFQANSTKIKLGYFYDRGQAERILSQVKSQGFRDAFVTHEVLNTGTMELAMSDSGLNYNSPDNSSYTAPTTSSSYADHNAHSSYYESAQGSTSSHNAQSYTPSSSAAQYKVRLASYEDPIWFDLNKVKDLGSIEQWSKSNWTIFVLGGFTNFEDAENARIKAYNRGFRDASVVIDNNGILEKLHAN